MTMFAEQKGGANSAQIDHPLVPADATAMDGLRIAFAPGKGHIERGPFDDVMEQTPDASGVTCETGSVGGVPGTWCRPNAAVPDAVILYLHGGAYIAGSAYAYRHFVGQIAARAGVAAFSADYRLAPEYRFPAAIHDAQAVCRGLAEQGARAIGVVGDSAGGGLVLALLARAQHEAGLAPCAAAVMSPWTDLSLTAQSIQDRADADPVLTFDALAAAARAYLNGHDAYDPLASPLYGNPAGVPPLQIHVGTDEILFDDASRYVERARAARVDATLHVWQGMPHVFQSNVGKLAAADAALDGLARFLRERLG